MWESSNAEAAARRARSQKSPYKLKIKLCKSQVQSSFIFDVIVDVIFAPF